MELLTDALKLKGLGYALIRRDELGSIRLLDCGSRTLSSAEKNYATIELEALAIAWAMGKAHFHLRACPQFKVLTDHRPLVGIFRKDIDDVENSRLQRIRMKTQCFNFTVEYTPGKTDRRRIVPRSCLVSSRAGGGRRASLQSLRRLSEG